MIKMNQLKYFVSTVEAGSLTTAAKHLFISQPALSKQLLQLESDLGCSLFNRRTTGMELTDAGRFFYEKVIKIINDVEQLTFDMRAFTEISTIRIGTLPSIGSHFVPALVPKLNASYKIELTIKDTTSELVDMLENDRIDFAFVQDANKHKNIIVENLFYEPYDAILPNTFLISESDKLFLEDFLKHALILHKHPCDIRAFFEKYLKKKELDYQVAMELEFNDSILPFVSNGVGATILPRMVSQQIQHPSTIVMKLEDKNFGRTIDFLYKSNMKRIAKEIMKWIKENSLSE